MSYLYTDKKENQIFLICKEIQSKAVAKSCMRKSFLIYEEMRKYFPIYEEAVSHIWLCNCSTLNFLIYEENLVLFFISVYFPFYGVTSLCRDTQCIRLWCGPLRDYTIQYLEYQSVCPFVRIGSSLAHSPASECVHWNQRGGATLASG